MTRLIVVLSIVLMAVWGTGLEVEYQKDAPTPPTNRTQELAEIKLAEQEIEGQEHIKEKRVKFMLKCQDMRSKFLYGE